jgi:hypothetical protein
MALLSGLCAPGSPAPTEGALPPRRPSGWVERTTDAVPCDPCWASPWMRTKATSSAHIKGVCLPGLGRHAGVLMGVVSSATVIGLVTGCWCARCRGIWPRGCRSWRLGSAGRPGRQELALGEQVDQRPPGQGGDHGGGVGDVQACVQVGAVSGGKGREVVDPRQVTSGPGRGGAARYKENARAAMAHALTASVRARPAHGSGAWAGTRSTPAALV